MVRNRTLPSVLNRLEAARVEKGLSYRALSEAAGMGINYCREVMTVSKSPSFAGIMSIIDALEADPDWILFGNAPPSRSNVRAETPFRDVGDRLIQLRLTWSGLSAESWARKFHFALRDYLSWEGGETLISVKAAMLLHTDLGVSLHWVYTGQPALSADPVPVWPETS